MNPQPPHASAAAHPSPLPARPEQAHETSLLRPAVGAVAAGLLLGPIDLWTQTTLPYPWANLANSGAVWAACAFALGRWSRRSTPSSAAAGMAMLLIAVQTYYLADVLVRHSDPVTLWNPASQLWLGLAVVVGLLFGGAGYLSRSAQPWVRFAAAAILGLVFLFEAGHMLERSGGVQSADNVQTASIEVLLALALPAAVLFAARRSAGSKR